MRIAGQVAFALLFSANAVAIFGHGWFGAGSLFTAAYLVTFTAALLLLGGRQAITLTAPDYLVIGLFACSAVSIALHPPSDPKQLPLFILSLAGYVAARHHSERILGVALVIPLIAIVAAGTIATVYTLANQPAGVYGKLEIFGQFGHATTEFTILLSAGLFALICLRAKMVLIASFIVLPIVAFTASQVRFAFIALVASLLLGAIAATIERKRLIVVAAIVVFSVLTGALCRLEVTLHYTNYAATSFGVPKALTPTPENPLPPKPAEQCEQVNLRNSIDIRKHLLAEALAILPSAGFTGIGLGQFAERSCVHAEVHNSILQAAVELGIPAGILLSALIVAVLGSLWPLAAKDPEALFALCIAIFSVLMMFVHGQIAEDMTLFLVLGYGARLCQQRSGRLQTVEVKNLGVHADQGTS